jgi:hypothetical protein
MHFGQGKPGPRNGTMAWVKINQIKAFDFYNVNMYYVNMKKMLSAERIYNDT